MQVFLTSFTPQGRWQHPLPDLDSPQTLVLVFGEPDTEKVVNAFENLLDKYPSSIIAGAASIAGISNANLQETGLVVAVIRFHTSHIKAVHASLPTLSDSRKVGEYFGMTLNAPDLKGILLLTDGLTTQGTEMIRGLASHINCNHVNIVGGLASDRMTFEATWVLRHGIPTLSHACAIGFYGDAIAFASQTRDGFKPFGAERLITHSDDRNIYQLDGQPALKIYKEYLGEYAKNLSTSLLNFPLAIWHQDKRHYAVRVSIAVNEALQSLQFVADIPAGYQTQFMYGSADHLIDGAEEAARRLKSHLPANQPVLALTISCAARKLIMGEDTHLELKSIMEQLPNGSQMFGFYGYGELAPTEHGGSCSHHNATMTLAFLYERN